VKVVASKLHPSFRTPKLVLKLKLSADTTTNNTLAIVRTSACAMALKRDHDSLDYSDAEDAPVASSSKRQRKQANKAKHRQPTVDPTYGQKCAFPVLADLSDDDLELEDQSEALAYLRAVQ
jgi:hypothetical protein